MELYFQSQFIFKVRCLSARTSLVQELSFLDIHWRQFSLLHLLLQPPLQPYQFLPLPQLPPSSIVSILYELMEVMSPVSSFIHFFPVHSFLLEMFQCLAKKSFSLSSHKALISCTIHPLYMARSLELYLSWLSTEVESLLLLS